MVDRADGDGGRAADERRDGDRAADNGASETALAKATRRSSALPSASPGGVVVADEEALVEVDGGEVAEAGDDDVEEFAGGGLQVEGVADAGAGLVQEGEVAPGGGGLAGGGAAGR